MEEKTEQRYLVVNPEGKEPLVKPMRRRGNDIKICLEKKNKVNLWIGFFCLRINISGGHL
jgi:hypothetical protein